MIESNYESFSDLPDSDTEFSESAEFDDETVADTTAMLEDVLDIDMPASDSDMDSGHGYPFDRDEWMQRGLNAIEQNMDAIRDDYRDKGFQEGEALDELLTQERTRLEEEFLSDFQNDTSIDSSDLPDETDGNDLAEALNSDETFDAEDILETMEDETEADESLEHEQENQTDITDFLKDEAEAEYDLDGINLADDAEVLDDILDAFEDDVWKAASLDARKENLQELADFVQDHLNLKNPPTITYYNNPDPGDYGSYSHDSNELCINEYTLDDNEEAADTIAHELWHAYQRQCADNPRPGVAGSVDWQRHYGLDPEHYVRPEYSADGLCINYDEYRSQMVEEEARAFAAQVRNRFHRNKGD